MPRPRGAIASIALLASLASSGCSPSPLAGRDSASVTSSPGDGPRGEPQVRAAPMSATSAPWAGPGCPAVGDGVAAGTVSHPAIVEASGLAASALTPGMLWTHNDSGDSARIFAIHPDGALAAAVSVRGAEAIDWEAIAAAPFEGAPALYLADIGDFAKKRAKVSVYVVREPTLAPPPAGVPLASRLDFTYEDGPHDAEALLVDPRSGAIVVATKNLGGGSGIYVAEPGSSVLTLATTLGGLWWVTDGSVSHDGGMIALRTYGAAYAWMRAPGASIVEALEGTRCRLKLAREPQGEALAFALDGRSYYTLSEGPRQPLWSFALGPPAP